MKYDQDFCLNFDLKKLLWQDELNPRVRCAFGNVSFLGQSLDIEKPMKTLYRGRRLHRRPLIRQGAAAYLALA